MKNLILAFLFLTVFVSNAAKNEPAFQPTAISDCLNITGATTFAVVKSAVWVGAFTIGLKSVAEMRKEEFAGGILLGVLTYLLHNKALNLSNSQNECTAYTSVHLRPLSKGLQTIASLSSLVISTAFVGYVINEFQL